MHAEIVVDGGANFDRLSSHALLLERDRIRA